MRHGSSPLPTTGSRKSDLVPFHPIRISSERGLISGRRSLDKGCCGTELRVSVCIAAAIKL